MLKDWKFGTYEMEVWEYLLLAMVLGKFFARGFGSFVHVQHGTLSYVRQVQMCPFIYVREYVTKYA